MHPALIALLIVLDLPFFYWFSMATFRDWNHLVTAFRCCFRPALRQVPIGGRNWSPWDEVKIVALLTAFTLIVLAQMALLRPFLV